MPGTDLREALSVLEHDPDTEAIALVGEIGGTLEMDVAAWIKDYHSRTKSPKYDHTMCSGTAGTVLTTL